MNLIKIIFAFIYILITSVFSILFNKLNNYYFEINNSIIIKDENNLIYALLIIFISVIISLPILFMLNKFEKLVRSNYKSDKNINYEKTFKIDYIINIYIPLSIWLFYIINHFIYYLLTNSVILNKYNVIYLIMSLTIISVFLSHFLMAIYNIIIYNLKLKLNVKYILNNKLKKHNLTYKGIIGIISGLLLIVLIIIQYNVISNLYLINQSITHINTENLNILINNIDNYSNLLFTSFILIILTIITYIYLFLKTIEKRINKLSIKLKDLSIGKLDINERFQLTFEDTIGFLGHNINMYLDRLQNDVNTYIEVAKKVRESANQLEKSVIQSSDIVEGITTSISHVGDSITVQAEITNESEINTKRILDNIDKVHNNLIMQADYVENTATSISEMINSIHSINENVTEASKISTKLSYKADEGKSVLIETLSSIKEIEKYGSNMMDIIGIISKIADKTNLLAMNAAIEAAHAGSSGKGFAVVASEVRKLADNTRHSTKQIIDLINEMKLRIDNGAELSNKLGNTLKEIVDGMNYNADLISKISKSMSELLLGANEVLSAIYQVIEASENIRNIVREQQHDSENTRKQLELLFLSTKEIKISTIELREAGEEITKVLTEITMVAESNSSIAIKLNDLLLEFSKKSNKKEETKVNYLQ